TNGGRIALRGRRRSCVTLLQPMLLFLLLPLLLAIFAIAGKFFRGRGALTILVAASIIFSATQGVGFLVLTAASTAANYVLVAMLIKRSLPDRARVPLLALGLVLNLLVLILFKYAAWLQLLPGIGDISLALSAMIPITLSFLTFQRCVALLDAYSQPDLARAGLEEAQPGAEPKLHLDRALRYVGFVTLFPNLLIGPIAYLVEIAPQFARNSFGRVRKLDLSIGGTLLAVGLFKKVVIADPLGLVLVNPTFHALADTGPINPVAAFLLVISYFAQLYFDFSGYSDMVLGVARMFGIRLPINFDSPLRSVGIIDFYRRWHITLTRVIARFLFAPLSIVGTRFVMRRKIKGVRAKLMSLWIPLLVNFVVIGLWHGPKETYLLFGLLHGLWYICETEIRATKRWKNYRKATSDFQRTSLGLFITLPPLMLTFSLFRSPDLITFGNLLASFTTNWRSPGGFSTIATFTPMLGRLGLAYVIIFLAPNAYEMLGRYRPGIKSFNVGSNTLPWLAVRWRPNLLWGIFVAILSVLVLRGITQTIPFAYGMF
ncbi:MAG TPA: MBOAT family O-acyltransferase, partial [Spongiibacteraceae bacterium]|nr:MBOAT family O-acyltransferase [Spongiibacteraceae bacterium]